MVFPFWVCCYTSPRPELNSCVASSTTPLSVVRTSLEAVPKTASCAPGGHPCRKAVFLAFPLMLDSATMLLYDQTVGFLGQTESPGFLPSPLWSSSLLRADACLALVPAPNLLPPVGILRGAPSWESRHLWTSFHREVGSKGLYVS